MTNHAAQLAIIKHVTRQESMREQEKKGATEDEMVGLNGHEFELTPGDSEGQGSLACCSPWGRKESDMT